MKYLEQVWFLLFTPEKKNSVVGYGQDNVRRDTKDMEGEENKDNKRDRENMEEDDDTDEDRDDEDYEPEEPGPKKLTSNSSRRFRKEWHSLWVARSAPTVDDNQSAQFAEAIITIPVEHPAHRGLVTNMFKFQLP